MSAMNIDVDAIRSLAELLDETNLSEIEVTQDSGSIRVARNIGGAIQHVNVPQNVAAPTQVANANAGEAAAQDLENHPGAVSSPMVGTAYMQSEPGAPSFVQVGQSVAEGDTLMIVEAMKVMNPIKAPKAGKVTQILVQDAQPVEFGEVLMIIE